VFCGRSFGVEPSLSEAVSLCSRISCVDWHHFLPDFGSLVVEINDFTRDSSSLLSWGIEPFMNLYSVSDSDLKVLGIEESVLKVKKKQDLLRGLWLFASCVFVGLILVGGSIGILISLVAAFLGRWCTVRTVNLVRREAHRNREHLELATAAFLELINVMIAGGSGVETAVKAAAEAGDGPGFSHLRVAIMRAHSSRTSYWDSLATLGRETAVDCLVEVAHTMQLAGESGARIRSSLCAKASALRKKNLARVEHSAEQTTEKMGLPLVVLFMGFLGLVGFPAFSQALSSL
jgi:tight adherence protein C